MMRAPREGSAATKLIGRVAELGTSEGTIPEPSIALWPKAGVMTAQASAKAIK
jgi:hypothetical protein